MNIEPFMIACRTFWTNVQWQQSRRYSVESLSLLRMGAWRIGNMCSCLEVRFPHKRLFAVCYLLVIPYSVILKLEIDTTTFVCPQFPSDLRISSIQKIVCIIKQILLAVWTLWHFVGTLIYRSTEISMQL